MDTETAESIDALRGDIRRVESTLSAEVGELRTQTSADIGELRAQISELRTEIRDSAAAGRRHTQVLFESLRDDIRLVAEGLTVVSAKVDRLTR